MGFDMRSPAGMGGAARVGPTRLVVWIGLAVFGLFALYLVVTGPASQAALDDTVRRSDEALCIKFGFPVGTQDNLSCVNDLRGVRNDALLKNAGIL